jgi:hypothetical protein
MARQIFDTIWVGLAIIVGFAALVAVVLFTAQYLPYVFIAFLMSLPFWIGWDIAKDLRKQRR